MQDEIKRDRKTKNYSSLELAIALEIAKDQRANLQLENSRLRERCRRAEDRADRLENRLHEVTRALAILAHDPVKNAAASRAIETVVDGAPVLRLENPIS